MYEKIFQRFPHDANEPNIKVYQTSAQLFYHRTENCLMSQDSKRRIAYDCGRCAFSFAMYYLVPEFRSRLGFPSSQHLFMNNFEYQPGWPRLTESEITFVHIGSYITNSVSTSQNIITPPISENFKEGLHPSSINPPLIHLIPFTLSVLS